MNNEPNRFLEKIAVSKFNVAKATKFVKSLSGKDDKYMKARESIRTAVGGALKQQAGWVKGLHETYKKSLPKSGVTKGQKYYQAAMKLKAQKAVKVKPKKK